MKTLFRRHHFCAQNPGPQKIKACLFSVTYKSLNLLTHLYLTSSVWLHLLWLILTFILATLESFALAVPSAWKALSQIISLRSSWKICPHNETVLGHAGQNSSALSWGCIAPLPVFFSSWALFSTQYILFISGVCIAQFPHQNISFQKWRYLYVLSIQYILEVLLTVVTTKFGHWDAKIVIDNT